MKIVVKAKPNSKIESVERVVQPTLDLPDTKSGLVEYKVCVKEAPVGGRANEAVRRAIARYFNVAPSLVKLISGASIKHKVFEISD
ncbi:MAG: hypothetical protein A2566_00155 [Candidatus Zambryskibacteria bacterium RIFOXYD1_FULL_40_13]|nr:MAG: hypothetical protein UT25_C0004G0019 [Parcubacteria group bacterium GW2011_GWC1_39_12]KKR19099.1 MAG: hypothetical protein UT49_C0003G0019 [Parcubacteria group bacterium GW2011_GWF1_39_37]KKR34989.1 MAG: hypothetical protein UT68_C0006G0036 [Parcubacteria group bacterium GW2011_GWC2_40_10]KKR51862.1 MAG: hypothetical protein UT89_C0005G0019 [Parcubacteria group bacterium GW2011_GWE1_40_20]KKR65297.1 MAG: hypothetical protein UU06_C0023G0006 [Parcubacteria group bacterium GW2011_GWB1_40_